VKGVTLEVYPAALHGLTVTHKDQVNLDLFDFVQKGVAGSRRPSPADE
jgi:hypothetical protein